MAWKEEGDGERRWESNRNESRAGSVAESAVKVVRINTMHFPHTLGKLFSHVNI